MLLKSHIRSAALHEAGHIAAAYFVEYACDEVYIDERGNGITRMNYGNDTILAAAIMSSVSWKQMFASLPWQIKINAGPVARRLCCILVAGGVAESIHKHGRYRVGTVQVSLFGTDLDHAQSISQYFQIDLDELTGNIYGIFKSDVFWNTIVCLTKSLIKQRHLDSNEIKLIISKNGLLEYLKTMTDQGDSADD
jgi:hypothetical protein